MAFQNLHYVSDSMGHALNLLYVSDERIRKVRICVIQAKHTCALFKRSTIRRSDPMNAVVTVEEIQYLCIT